jgi:deoxyribonuclease-4
MPIGAHVSTSGGLPSAVKRAIDLGAECVQIFLSPPQRWDSPRHTDEQVEEFARQMRAARIGPNFAHARYLINLASQDASIRGRSIDALATCAAWAERCDLIGVVVHIGSGRGQPIDEAMRHVADGLRQVLEGGGTARILLENSAGSGNMLGARFTQLGALLDMLGRDPRLGLCLDTAHAFASGYDLRTDDGLAGALEDLERHVGLQRLRIVHANDSKVRLGAAVDRHENIGRGLLGDQAFQGMLSHPALADLPWVLEVPGFDNKGPDAPNVQALKRLAGRGNSISATSYTT